jgi:hypothetical protein
MGGEPDRSEGGRAAPKMSALSPGPRDGGASVGSRHAALGGPRPSPFFSGHEAARTPACWWHYGRPTDGHAALAPGPRVLDSSGPWSPKPARIAAYPRVRPRLGAPRKPHRYAVSGASTPQLRLPENRGVASSILALAIPANRDVPRSLTTVKSGQKRPPGVHELPAPARSASPRRPAEGPSARESRERTSRA